MFPSMQISTQIRFRDRNQFAKVQKSEALLVGYFSDDEGRFR